MKEITYPNKALEILLNDAIQRDRTTARRACLTRILEEERYLNRAHLIARVDAELGTGCFGRSAWEDTFYRDMKVVKRALKADGYRLVYSRSQRRPGYYLQGAPHVGPSLSAALDGAVSEVDSGQIAVLHKLSPGERYQIGVSISNTAREVVSYRIRQMNPKISKMEALRLSIEHGRSG